MTDEPLAARFCSLFLGSRLSHGTYSREDPSDSGPKTTIKATAQTLRRPATESMWEQHLEGVRPLGVVPIGDADCCVWGAVDVDTYVGLDHAELVRELEAHSIPAFIFKSKSGGAHIVLFFSEPVPARILIPRLRELAALVGHGGSEIFPKQERVDPARGDLGSWLNMPYYGGDGGSRHALRPDGRAVAAEDFLDAAEEARISIDDLGALVLRPSVDGFEDGPPCLESFVATGFPPGTRNNGFLALGVYAKKKYPDDWQSVLETWNRDYVKLDSDEVASAVKGLKSKDYHYRCKDKPLNMRCNVALCRTREHGVGQSNIVSIVEGIQILMTDPPIFLVHLRTDPPGLVELSADNLLNPRAFRSAVLSQCQQYTPEYRKQDWDATLGHHMKKAKPIPVGQEAGVRGRFWELLEQFVTDRHRAERREDILLGKPWRDEDSSCVYFRLRDLETALDRARFAVGERGVGVRSWVAQRLREMAGGPHQLAVRGRNVATWFVPDGRFEWARPAHELPLADDSPL